jgi:hypothetical protein
MSSAPAPATYDAVQGLKSLCVENANGTRNITASRPIRTSCATASRGVGKQQALHATFAAVQTWQGVARCSVAALPDRTLTER